MFVEKKFLNSKTDFVVRKTIFLQEKSIWCEIFQHSVTKKILEFQNGFCCRKNDFSTGKIDLVWNLSTFCDKKNFGIPKTILLYQNRFCCGKNESSVESIRRGLISRGLRGLRGFGNADSNPPVRFRRS